MRSLPGDRKRLHAPGDLPLSRRRRSGRRRPGVNPLAAGDFPTLTALLDRHKIVAAAASPRDRGPLVSLDAHGHLRTPPGSDRPGRHHHRHQRAGSWAVLWAPSGRGAPCWTRAAFSATARPGAGAISSTPTRIALLCGGEAGQTAAQRRALRSDRRRSGPAHPRRSGGRGLPWRGFTNQAWRDELGYVGTPVYTPGEGGRALWHRSPAVRLRLL
ncbi:MAG: hypothetical protein R2838_16420 [Caldilineaceae bacterium]